MNSRELGQLVEISRSMQSLVARLENKAHLTSKDISGLREHIVSIQYRVDYSLVAMSKSLGVLHDKIESIVSKQETLMNSVNSLLKQKEADQDEMNWHPALRLMPVMESEELPDSPVQILERGTSPDITCSETIGLCKHQLEDQRSPSDGTGDFLEWEKVDELMKNLETLT